MSFSTGQSPNGSSTDARRTQVGVARPIIAAVVLLMAAVVCVGRPDALAALTLVPPWCWLLAGLFSTVVVWRIRRRRLAGVLALLWMVFAVGWVEELSSLARVVSVRAWPGAHPEGRTIRIASLNCANTERCIADLLRAESDIVLLQEAPGDDGLATMASRLFGHAGSFVGGGDVAILARGQLSAEFVDRSSHFVAASMLP